MIPSAELLAQGTVVGSYRIIALRGTGAMGAVYEAVHSVLGKHAALKIMHAALLQDPRQTQRFVREGQAAAAIRHPHVVQIFDVGLHEGRPYLVMEFLQGDDLAATLEQEGPLSPQRACDVLLPVVSAVAAAHDSGVVHRDLKPANILLDRGLGGALQPKVVDFGISKFHTAPLTATSAIMGSPVYMAPEQFESRSSPASDQWALGVILYELCTRGVPFTAESIPGLMYQICHGNPVPPRAVRPDLPAALEATILRALSRDPAQRFANVRELGGALLPFAGPQVRERFAAEMKAPVPPTRPTPTVGRWRRQAALGGVTAAATLLCVLGLRHALSSGPAREVARPQPATQTAPEQPAQQVASAASHADPTPSALQQPEGERKPAAPATALHQPEVERQPAPPAAAPAHPQVAPEKARPVSRPAQYRARPDKPRPDKTEKPEKPKQPKPAVVPLLRDSD